jgi:hypothetical protein
MSNALADLMERNLLDVFGEADPARRAVAIAELYTADYVFRSGEADLWPRSAQRKGRKYS